MLGWVMDTETSSATVVATRHPVAARPFVVRQEPFVVTQEPFVVTQEPFVVSLSNHERPLASLRGNGE